MELTKPAYTNLESLYSSYKSPAKELIFEGHKYEFIGALDGTDRDVSKHVYRDADENHTLVIHLVGSKPFYIDAHYSINDADIISLQKVQA